MKKILLALLCAPLFMATTCDSEAENEIICTTEVRRGLEIKAINSATGLPIPEGLTITATDGSYSETLTYIPGLEYVYGGAEERPGNYTITISKPGFQTYVSGVVTVNSDVCHVITESRTFTLQPE